MKIGFVSDSLTSSAGGIFEIERSLALALRDLGQEIVAWGIRDDRWDVDGALWGTIECRLMALSGPRSFGFARGWVGDLVDAGCDVLHLQHLWMYPSVVLDRWHAKTRRPFLVTPNGMLEPWTLRHSGWKKKLAALVYEKRMLGRAACLQANTVREIADIRDFGLSNPVCLIPNGVNLPGDVIQPIEKREEKTLLFLGRLHPKKGLANALRAWANCSGREGWCFVVAGWDQGGHEAELKALCRELNVPFSSGEVGSMREGDGSVQFVGPAFGAAKDELMRSADAFILPSYSEGLPMAVLEAWAHRLPVLMTSACNLPEGFAAGAALETNANEAAIGDGMRMLFGLNDEERKAMGRAGRMLVEERFTWGEVAAQMKEVHEWLAGGGPRPGCVE